MFRYRKASFNRSASSLDPQNCTDFPSKTGFRYAMAVFKTSFTLSGEEYQYSLDFYITNFANILNIYFNKKNTLL